MALEVILFPHADMHVALNGTPDLRIRVMQSSPAADNLSYQLTQVPFANIRFTYFAPYHAVGNRFHPFVNIEADGTVTPLAVGTNLIYMRIQDLDGRHHYHIARIQVHDTIQGWWFGNESITTAYDLNHAHAQPSIYALFSDDASGTDLVGDITGHGYVNLTSSDPSIFTVNPDGRLQGRVSNGNATLNGSFLGQNHSLPVKVFDYTLTRNILEGIQVPDLDHFQEAHNILFLPEGFRDTPADSEKFDRIVSKIADDLFNKPRHSPFNLLEGSFNVFKAYLPSTQHAMTIGLKVNDESTPRLSAGRRIPYGYRVSTNKSMYKVEQLVHIVGLPLRSETDNTAALKARWSSQSLANFDPGKVDDDLAEAWKKQKSVGILDARDTLLGLYIAPRFADRRSKRDRTLLGIPANDSAADALLAPFIKRVYEWFNPVGTTRRFVPDPRRHPPELYLRGYTNYGNSILKLIGAMRYKYPPHGALGQEWVPDHTETVFKKSQGLIAIIANDTMHGATNFNAKTMTATTMGKSRKLGFEYQNAVNIKRMRRTPPDEFQGKIEKTINTVGHEFGHSFNLGDEYEGTDGDDPKAILTTPNPSDNSRDNITRLHSINLNAQFVNNRQIDPDEIKWLKLPRMDLSAATIEDSTTEAGKLKVKIDTRFISKWVEAKAQNKTVNIRNITIRVSGKQLPTRVGDAEYITNLDIGEIDEADGTIQLGGMELPIPIPQYPKGSVIFVAKRDDSDQLIFVTEKKVIEKLESTHLPLNKDTSRISNTKPDTPVDIADFKPPCDAYKLIGLYEGGFKYGGANYRPAGLCKMRKRSAEFCFVCKYLIVNRVNPGVHDFLDKKKYPKAKKND